MEQAEYEERLARQRVVYRENERPLRVSRSRSRENISPKFGGSVNNNERVYERVFQSGEEKEAALRRRRLIEATDPYK